MKSDKPLIIGRMLELTVSKMIEENQDNPLSKNQNNIISIIDRCYESDSTVSEFFQLVQQNESLSDHYVEDESEIEKSQKVVPDVTHISEL